MKRARSITFGAILGCGALVLIASAALATEVRTAGDLKLPAGTSAIAICTDPVMQSVLNDALRVAMHPLGEAPMRVMSLTVSVTQKLLQPGVGLSDLAPGDVSVVNMMKDAGADVPPLGDSGNKPLDPYAENARRQALGTGDPLTNSFRNYQAMKESMSGRNAPMPYDKMADQIYDTVIIARATLGGVPGHLIVVAVAHGGDDITMAKKRVAEEVVNAVLH